MNNKQISSCEIWWVTLPKGNGSTQSGYRPCFIISNNKNNTYSPTVNVIPITSKMNKRKLPCHVEIWNYKECGLQVPSTLMVEQIQTIPTDCIDKYIGKIKDGNIIDRIVAALAIQLPIITMVSDYSVIENTVHEAV